MKKVVSLFIAVMVISLTVHAQDDGLGDNRYKVTIQEKGGGTSEAIGEIYWHRPWQYQRGIWTFDESLLSEPKIKKKQKTEIKPKEYAGFEADGKKFVAKKLMIAGGEYGGDMKALPKWYFVEVVEEGAITVYRAYSNPPAVASGVTFETIYESIRNNPEYYMEKDGMKSRWMTNVTFDKWIADSDETMAKWKNGEYGNFKRKEGKKFGNFMKSQMENENPNIIISAIRDYNTEMQ